MNVYEFINNYFFSQNTLKFFGERISEIRILKKTVMVKDYAGKEHETYCLGTYQHNAPILGRRHFYFETETFENITV